MAFGDFTVDRNSTKYVLGSSGSYVSYATDEPAFEFNSDGSYKGLLVEPASKNEVRNGSATGSTAGTIGSGGAFPTNWQDISSGSGLTIEVIGTGTENGVNYIDIKASGTATGSQFVLAFESVFISAADTEVWTESAFLKLVDDTNLYNDVKLRTYNYDSGGFFVNSITGSALTVSTTSLDRFEETFTLSGATIAFTRPAIVFSLTATNSYDFTVRIGWVQMEESPIATSPIPTTSAAVTRVKDDITQTSASSLIGQTEGTLYVEVDWRLTSGVDQALLDVSDGTFSNRLIIYNDIFGILRMQARVGGTTIVFAGESSTGYSGIQKFAFAYADGDFELYRNGASKSTVTGSLAALATLTDIDLGQDVNASAQANMHIRAVAIYPTRLSDAEAQALTTL